MGSSLWKSVDCCNGSFHSLFVRARDTNPPTAACLEFLPKPPCHPLTHVFAIAKSVLDERDIAIGEDVDRIRAGCRDGPNRLGWSAEVSLVPDAGRERIRVADQNPVAASGVSVLACLLRPRDVNE